MATSRQGNQGQGGPNQGGQGRQNGGVSQQAGEAVRAAQEGLSQAGSRLREGYESASEGAQYGYRRAEGAIARNPTNSVLIGFGVGFGVGLALCALMTREESWVERAESHLPRSVRKRIPRSFERKAEHAGDAVQTVVDQVTESLRGLPEAIAKVLPSSMSWR